MENYYKTQFSSNQAATVLRGIEHVMGNSTLVDRVSTYDRKIGRDHYSKTYSGTVQNVSDVDRIINCGGAQHLGFCSDVKERTVNISENMSRNMMHENEMLKNKVMKIEMENHAQQRHLKQLEKIVMELAYNRSSAHIIDIQRQPPHNESVYRDSPSETIKDVNKMGESPLRKGWEDMEQVYRSEVDEELSRDVASLMDEFDRNARENGIVYSMTPCHSFVDSEDLAEVKGIEKETLSSPFKSLTHSENVSAYPLPAFLTPSYHGVDSHINPHSYSDEPLVSPQLCFTTPVLLTTEALREAEGHQDLDQQYLDLKNKVHQKLLPHFPGSGEGFHSELPVQDNLKKSAFSFSLGSKSGPFSNLLAGLHQKSHSNLRQNKSLGKGRCSVRGDGSGNLHYDSASDDLCASHLPGIGSPGSSVSSVCGQVRRWSRTLKHPLLSPLSGSHCSDLETHTDEDILTELMFSVAEKADAEASDEEDLVVDEVVSLSVAGGSRHRCESFCSITGPCVPPDLLLDTKKSSGEVGVEVFENQVKEEDILTEIAGELEDSVMLEDTKDVLTTFLKGGDHVQVVEANPELHVGEKQVECHVEEKPEAGLESSRSVLELNGSKPQVIDKKAQQVNNTSCVDHKDVKLPAGSIILAMVNESGSLVPLPQLQVAPQSLSNSVKLNFDEKILDEEVDIETMLEKTPVLEAGDLDSLLAQFEASEAVNKNGSGSPEQENKSKSNGQPKPTGSVSSVANGRLPSVQGTVLSSNSPQISPTHQNIKDALPKEIIEKIKASTKRKSTQMLSEPVVVRKGRGVRQQETAVHRAKAHRVVSRTAVEQTSTDLRVPPPLDHDYCCSPEKQKKNKHGEIYATTDDGMFTKLPDYYTTVPRREVKKPSISDDSHDDGGKKDSGVESGDVSDASIETEERRKDGKDSRCTEKDWSARDNKENGTGDKNENIDVYNKLPAYMTDIGNSMPKEDADAEGSGDGDKEETIIATEKPQVKKIKRKLNLSEYRQRIQSAQSSRCPSPALTNSANTSPSSTPLQVPESIEKLVERTNSENGENTQVEGSENGLVNSVSVEEDMEEGELKGDSESETLVSVESESLTRDNYTGRLVSGNVKSQKEIGINTSDKAVPGLAATLFSSSNFASCNGHWKNGSRTSSMRRWSSSSRSRSRSRSPLLNKKQHTSRKHRSSRGKRKRTHTPSHSSQSPHSSSRRRWSRSHSRSKSRGRSSSSCSLSCSSSRSRSRSRSVKTRDRWGYSRRFSSRERRRRSHSRSRSRSSSRYSRVTRSRSPVWGTVRRSRSPVHRFSLRPRRPEDEDRTRQVEERRVIYIGRISEGTTKGDLRRRFQKFGEIVDISVHFREHGDNYGFVTFKNRDEAYYAVEHGNDDPSLSHYDLCFGGRRAFCRVQYSDLDAQADAQYVGGPVSGPVTRISPSTMDFDSLLRAAMKKKTR